MRFDTPTIITTVLAPAAPCDVKGVSLSDGNTPGLMSGWCSNGNANLSGGRG